MKTTTIRKIIATNLNNVYFNAIKRVIYLKLTKETITISFVLFASNAKKKIKMLLLNKIIVRRINCFRQTLVRNLLTKKATILRYNL